MMNINFDTYNTICDLLALEIDDTPVYSVDEIANMVGVDVATVQWVYRSEYDIM